MPLFVNFRKSEWTKIIGQANSTEVREKVMQERHCDVEPAAVECLLDYFTEHHDLWLEDSQALHPGAEGAFFALKFAWEMGDAVVISYPDYVDESEHIVNALEKRGYSPWY